MFNWQTYTGNLGWLQKSTIFLTRSGSHAYGTNTLESDEDFRGIAIPPKEYFLGFINRFDQAEWKEPDCVIFDIRKFFELAANANPNVLEILFTDPQDHALRTPLGDLLIANRHLFLSRKARFTYSGYAIAQLKRIRGHKAWLLNPKEIKPTRKEFGLPEQTVMSADILGAIDNVNEKEENTTFSAEVMTLYQKERNYHNALQEYQQYQNWKNTRNPQRAILEAQWGYDSKHASHLIRLIRSGKELLQTGNLIVKRPDAEELLAIRNGAMTYDQIVAYAENLDTEMEELEKNSPLPKSPDRNKLDVLCQQMVGKFLEIE